VLGILAAAAPAAAGPAADVVIVWADHPAGPATAAIADAARRAGAAIIDVSPPGPTAVDASGLVSRGVGAYGALEFDAALTALDAAAEQVDRTGGGGLDAAQLGDLFLYRGLVQAQRGDDAHAWDDFVTAAAIDPTRILDPARFPPRAVEQHTRAQVAIAARPIGRVALSPRGCVVRIDGAVITGDSVDLRFGRHWLRGECPGHEPTSRRIVIDRAELAVEVAGAPIAPPTDDELAIQGRSAGARAIVAVALRGDVAIVRRLGVDGREQDRASVTITGDRDAATVADTVTRLLAPPTGGATRRWYRSGWVWAAAGAVIASAILIPIALSAGGSGGDPPVVLRPDQVPPW
jgi:hypothetical protein